VAAHGRRRERWDGGGEPGRPDGDGDSQRDGDPDSNGNSNPNRYGHTNSQPLRHRDGYRDRATDWRR
jgi:hypothetical protein